MKIDNHPKTIAELEKSTNHTIAGLLPGFIRRHREEIMDAVREDYRSGLYCSWASMASVKQGANVVLDVLSEGLDLKDEPESPEKGCICDGEVLCDGCQ